MKDRLSDEFLAAHEVARHATPPEEAEEEIKAWPASSFSELHSSRQHRLITATHIFLRLNCLWLLSTAEVPSAFFLLHFTCIPSYIVLVLLPVS